MRTSLNDQSAPDPRVSEEIEFARALSALILAARLHEAEVRAEEAYRLVVGDNEPLRSRRIA